MISIFANQNAWKDPILKMEFIVRGNQKNIVL